MLKRFLASAVAAGALSVPLGGIAVADPDIDNPGLPGNIDGVSPGSAISDLAQVPGQSTPETVYEVTAGRVRTPGEEVRNFAPSIPVSIGGVSPGSVINDFAQEPDQSTPETVRAATGGSAQTPGDAVSDVAHDK
ncbi:hypothetical protein E4P42_18905 [Mycobacterium sp. PS03-16]|uniref:hypothetical protein n=1 Tax=Mycobacterium sp. PS03-16 TaxID=2559611 RepID=UPI001073EE25|nr:hypothetical protein [Mycobacterium sp. PS03-16]TFV56474.1 hypothetical protein E4P42_18905 [Mycobacterium sp. PS03-16]